jgi:NTP pyrophosphatase (non-canonical NTP hydrolase)
MLFLSSTKNRCKIYQGCAVDKIDEIITIAQEECGELVQVVSKVRRFGLEENRDKLTQEAGDVLAMIQLMIDFDIVNREAIEVAKINKVEKLKVWSNIFKD